MLSSELRQLEDQLGVVLDLTHVDRAALDRLQSDKLEALVEFVRRHVPYYAELDLPSQPTLGELPIVDKATLMRGLPRTCVSPGPTIAELSGHLAEAQRVGSASLYDDQFEVVRTSGTTGYVGYFLWDAPMAKVAEASATRFVPAPRALPKPVLAVAPIVSFDPLSGVLEGLYSVPFGAGLDATVERLHAIRPKTIIGSTGLVAELADLQIHGDLSVAPEVVVIGSEQCTAGQRRSIKQAWGLLPADQYGLSEAGLIASACAEGNWHVHEDTVIIELLDAQGQPCEPGARSHRALLTRLFGPLQPLIRYELGDVLVRGPDQCPCGAPFRTLAAIEGRQRAQLWLESRQGGVIAVSASAVVGALEGFDSLQRYQIRYQEPGELQIAIVTDASAGTDRLRRDIADEVSAVLVALGAVVPLIDVIAGDLPSVWAAPAGSKDHHVVIEVTGAHMATSLDPMGR